MARPEAPVEDGVGSGASSLYSSGILQAWLGTLLATVVTLRVLGRVDRAMLLWPVSGVALALFLPQWHKGRARQLQLLIACGAGFWTAALALGMPLPLASMIAMLTCIDVALGGLVLGQRIKTFEDLKDESNILRFLALALVAPALTGTLGAYPIAVFLKQPPVQTALMNVLANSLGIAFCVPWLLLLRNGDWLGLHKPGQNRMRLIAAMATFFLVSGYVFWQTSNPFLFMVFPPMILLILTMGLEGSVFVSAALMLMGWFATSHGHGPIRLAQGGPLHQLLVFQGFIWICLATSLPVGAILDERRRAEQGVKESQSIYRVLLQNAEDLIVLSSLDGSQRYVSPAVTRLAGWTQEEYLAMDRFETLHPEDQEIAWDAVRRLRTGTEEQTVRYRMKEKSGGWKWVQASVRAYGAEGEAIAGYVGTIRDISGQKKVEDSWREERQDLVKEQRKMAALASMDPLTGLLNRRGFEELVAALKKRSSFPVALLMVDIDHFKRYNDHYGHPQGDVCIAQVAKVLRSHATRTHDIVARLGGEEFAVVLAGAGLQEAVQVGEATCSVLESLGLEHAGSPFGMVTVSVGAAVQTGGELDITQLMAQADSALYLSKRVRNRVTAYSKQVEPMRA